jgi:hypothetical protein
MNETANHIEQLLESVTQYGQLSAELWKLKAVDKVAELLASSTKILFLLILFALSFLFCAIGLAFFLGTIFSSNALGFVAIGLIFGIFGILVYFNRYHWIKWPVRNAVICEILKDK